MKKVLITGATGFVGQHLADNLLSSNQYEIFGTSFTPSEQDKKIQIEQIDLTNFEKTQQVVDRIKPDFIYHLAALTSPSESFKNPTPVVLGNIEMQMNLLNAVKKLGVSGVRIMIVSSGEVYGSIDEKDLPITEETPFRPTNPYAVSKVTQDLLGLQYSLSYKLDIVRVRPFNHTGPGQTNGFVIPAFAEQIAKIEKNQQDPILKVGNMTAERDFADVRDIVKGYVALMEKGVNGEVYNIGSGKSVTIKKMLDILLSFSTTQIRVEEDPERMRPIEIPTIYGDYQKLKNLTGWTPEIPRETTLKDTLDYWRSIV